MRGPAVIVSPARDRPLEEHVRAGAVIARATSGRRVAVVASADHGHAHDANGPYGFDPAAADYDARVVEIVRDNRLADLVDLDPAFVAAASADSWWQMLMLHGALGDEWRAELLSYEAPTYFGMLCASFERR
jgi:aromatic ring-opening dioxygenase LigB subunit